MLTIRSSACRKGVRGIQNPNGKLRIVVVIENMKNDANKRYARVIANAIKFILGLDEVPHLFGGKGDWLLMLVLRSVDE